MKMFSLISLRFLHYSIKQFSVRWYSLIKQTISSYNRPALIVPLYRHKKCLSPKIVFKRICDRTVCKTDSPPVTVLVTDYIHMTCSFYWKWCRPVAKNRISRTRLIFSPYISASCYCYHMAKFRTALRYKQIIPAIYLINMWSLWVIPACTVPYKFFSGNRFARNINNFSIFIILIRKFKLAHKNPIIKCSRIIYLSVIVKEKWRVYSR